MVSFDSSIIYKHSENVISREIEGEVMIIPLTSGIGDMEDELYSLNDTGKEIWNLIDGLRSLNDIIRILSDQYDAPTSQISEEVIGLVYELSNRKIIEVSQI